MQIKTLLDKQELTMQLYPKHLGKVAIKIVEENGVILASAQVENEKVKESMINSANDLIKGLEEKGLRVESFEVEVNSDSNYKQQEMDKARRKSAKRISEIINKIELETNQEIKKQVSNITTVDITA